MISPETTLDERAFKRWQVLFAINEERDRQDFLFPGQWPNIEDGERLAILVEEVGEVAKELCDGPTENLRTELIQVAAVAVAWAEQL